MMRAPNRSAHRRIGFSLVELMIVIVIIVLLISILLPVLSRAYKTALASADSALISQISMGCEMYHQAFSEYPISYSNPANATTLANSLWPPPPIRQGKTLADTLILSGAAKVFSSLSGFSTVPAAGPPVGVGCGGGIANSANWDYPCGLLTSRGILVPDVPGSTTERQPAYGPYFVASAKQQSQATVTWGALTVQQDVFASRFERANAPSGSTETGAPILYYRANAAPTDTDGNGTIDSWDIYNYEDNYVITSAGAPFLPPGVNPPFRWRYPLYAPSDGKTAKGGIYDVASTNFSVQQTPYFGITKPFTKDPAGAANIVYPTVPYNASSFILISPGPDGLYFTADDVTNFKQ